MTGFEKKINLTVTLRATKDYCYQTHDCQVFKCQCLDQEMDGRWWCTSYGLEIELERYGPHIGSWKRLPCCREEHGNGCDTVPGT